MSNALLYRPYGFDQGFHEWLEVARGKASLPHPGELVNQRVQEWLSRRTNDQFFLYVHYMDVHDRRAAREPEEQRYWYSGSVAVVDRAIGELMQMLRNAGLLDHAVVILTSDHGDRLGEQHPVAALDGHLGNPSFESVLRVPLIVAPQTGENSDRVFRSDDVFDLITRVAGLVPGEQKDLEPGELFLTEIGYRTYLKGNWKSIWPRRNLGGLAIPRPKSLEPILFNIAGDPLETSNVAAENPEVLADHKERVDDLTEKLASAGVEGDSLTPLDRERLRSLGYLE